LLQPDELEVFNANMWLASPACQPYTVLGLGKGAADPRAKSFIHLIEEILPVMVERQRQPEYILVENVAGFEVCSADYLKEWTVYANRE
jgi:tRNA (cytosine38-C5)-methyltransferase